MKLVALVDTVAKKRPYQSGQLAPELKLDIHQGRTFAVESVEDAEDNHVKATLGYQAGTWYFYKPHVRIDKPRPQRLSESDYVHSAASLGCEVAVVKALVEVEAAGAGFLPSGKSKILFEAHWFSHFTDDRYNRASPHLSQTHWNRSLYKGGEAEWSRFEEAASLDRNAAIQSTSWGLGQVMGFNYRVCGFMNPNEFYQTQFRSEREQLKCLIAFIKSKSLDRFLKHKDWSSFAYHYNGKSYAVHGYHTRFAQAYLKYSSQLNDA